MKRKHLVVFVACAIVVLLADSAWAGRPDKDWKSWFGHFAGGYAGTAGTTGELIEEGWNLNGGATWWPDGRAVGVSFELGYNTFDVQDEVVSAISGVTSGDVEIWSITADVLWSPPTSGTVGVNLMGGIGGYRLSYDLGRPGVYNGIICDPWWWGWCVPGTIVGTTIVASESSNEFGWNIGAALTFNVGLGSHIFLEAKYHRVETSEEPVEYLPVVLGYRW